MSRPVQPLLAALAAGALFGAGLVVSGMTSPDRVIGFLDLAGHWNPSLAVVMAAALAVALPAFRLVLRRPRPLWAEAFDLPRKSRLDRPLVLGALVFGIGWGLAGFCPGPGLVGLLSGAPDPWIFMAGLVAGNRLAARFA